MKSRIFAVILLLGGMVPTALAVILWYDNHSKYCTLYWNGQAAVSENRYWFDEVYGQLYLIDDDSEDWELWQVWYGSQTNPAVRYDIPGVFCGSSVYTDEFHLDVYGKNLTGPIYLPYIQTPDFNLQVRCQQGGGVAATGWIYAPYASLHHVWIEGDMAGGIDALELNQQIHDYFLRIDGDLTGTITLAGDVVFPVSAIAIGGDIRDGGSITIGGNLNGKILVNGSLCDSVTGPEITVAGVMGSSATIAIDYDGWQNPDIWATGAMISVNGTGYTGNTPADRVYEITRCKGDLNNDGAVTWRDIDPFVDAQGDGAAYVANYPGLAGSRVFHADMDCDGVVNWRDVDPFVARMNGCCWEECGPCPLLGGGAARPAPGVVADGLLTNIAPRNLARLLDLVRDAALLSSDAATRQYWADVRAALGD